VRRCANNLPRLSVSNIIASLIRSSSSSTSSTPFLPKGLMAAARAAFARVAPVLSNVRARSSPALRRAALTRGYATSSENTVRTAYQYRTTL
jgi:hypothetical protein